MRSDESAVPLSLAVFFSLASFVRQGIKVGLRCADAAAGLTVHYASLLTRRSGRRVLRTADIDLWPGAFLFSLLFAPAVARCLLFSRFVCSTRNKGGAAVRGRRGGTNGALCIVVDPSVWPPHAAHCRYKTLGHNL